MNQINYCHFPINHFQFSKKQEDSTVISSNSQNDAKQQYDLGLNVALFNGFFFRQAIVSWAAVLASENPPLVGGLNSLI